MSSPLLKEQPLVINILCAIEFSKKYLMSLKIFSAAFSKHYLEAYINMSHIGVNKLSKQDVINSYHIVTFGYVL